MTTRVLETILLGRDQLSPVVARARANMAAFDQAVTGSAARQVAATNSNATGQQTAANRVVAANSRTAESATTSATAQQRAHARAAESATLNARAQQVANTALIQSNGLLGTSLTPLTAGLGAVALGFGYAAYRGMAFDAAMSQVQAATMATGMVLGDLRDLAIEAGAATQYSAEEAAQGITELAKAGVSTADILGGGLAGALNLAAAGQIEVADAAEIAATAMNVFGLSGDQVNHVADLLAAGAGKAQGSVGDMSAALNQSALVANQTGLSIEDTAGALALFASNGLIGSDAGTSFKTMLQSLNPSSVEAANLMDQLGLRAYDAQGNFVGLEAYAGQLKDGLSELSVEQQNAALKTIFGSDAVRAASVLYQAGAEGVREWTRNVNDAGFAAEQAAILNDNLRGDLERLGGAFDSAMTELGAGAQGPLRWLVQSLNAVVDAGGDVIGFINDLPGPVQALAASIAALLIVNGPLAGMFPALIAKARQFGPAIMSATTAVQAAGLAAQGSAGAMTALGVATAGARAAVLGLLTTAAPFAALGLLAAAIVRTIDVGNAAEDAKERVDELTAAYDDARGPERYRAVAGSLDQVRDAASDARQKLSELNAMSAAEQFFSWDYAGDVRKAEADFEAAQDAVDELAAASDRAERSIGVLSNRYGMSREQVEDFADAHGIDLSGSLQIVQSDFMRVFEATAAYDSQTGKATVTAEDYAKAISEGDKAIKDLIASLTILRGGQLSVTEAENSFGAALDAANDALDEKSGSVLDASGRLNSYSQAGRAAYDALTALSDGANETIAAMIRQGSTADELAAKDAELRQTFFDTALQMTGNRQAAEDLTNQYFGIPTERQTRIDALIDQAMADAATITETVNTLPDGNIDVYANTAPAEQTLQQFLSSYRGVVIGTGTYRGEAPAGTSGLPGLPNIPGRATGGRLSGPGTGTSDSILGIDAYNGMPTAWVSNREFVVNAAQTDRNLALIEAINAGQVPAGVDPSLLQYLAAGGRTALGATTVNVAANTAGWAAQVAAATLGFAGAGGGSIGSGWQALFNTVQAAFPLARANSTYRPGDPGFHGSGRAVDLGQQGRSGGAGHPYLAAMNRWLYDNHGAQLAELIYDGLGDDRPDLKNGRPHTYNAAIRAQHANHVHVAKAAGGLVDNSLGSVLNPHVRDQGGPLLPGYTLNATGGPEMVVSPAAMPGYGTTNVTNISNVRNYEIKVIAGLGADAIANTVVARLRTEEWLSS